MLAVEGPLKDLYARAQGEVSIREALRELDKWGEVAVFNYTDYTVRLRPSPSLLSPFNT